MAQENGSPFKLVFSKFGSWNHLRCPIPNGNPKSWVDKLLRLVDERGEEVVLSQFRYLREATDSYQTPYSDNIFRHHNFFGYFIRRYNMNESCVTEEEAEDEISKGSTSKYYYVIETEWSNLRFLAEGVDIKDQNGNIYRYYPIEEYLTPKLINLVKSNKVKIIFTNIVDPSEPTSYYNEIDQRLEDLGIPTENIIWVNGNAPVNAFDPNRKSKSIYISSLLSLTQAAENYHKYPTITALKYNSDLVRPLDLDVNKKRPKRFLCFNRMINRPHRLAIAYIALKYNLLDDSIFSFINLSYPENIIYDCREYWEEPNDDLIYSKKIIDLMPYELDTHHLSAEEKESFTTVDNNKKEYYENTYFHIVSETRLGNEPSCFMSEKTWRPILNLQPFLYLGNYKALAQLKELGFKTFDNIIDESYDDVLDPVIRFKMVQKEILRLKEMSMDQIHDLYYSVTDRLIYNQQLLSNYTHYDPLENLYKLK